MNYRHAYHAGNFADVLKHATLAMVIAHLKQKDAPFRVIDTHAGPGIYDLAAEQAEKTREWRQGIGRLLAPGAEPLPAAAAEALAPYLAAVRALNGGDALSLYPGSPWLARHLLRRGDRLVVNELHPEDAAELKAHFARDRQTKVLALDGWIALKSLLPPPERRGVVLVDPPFEAPGEMDRLVTGLRAGLARFATGIYLLWYPIKTVAAIDALYAALLPVCPKPPLRVESFVRAPRDAQVLNGAGLAIINPPYRLEEQLAAVLPEITRRLAVAPGAYHRLEHATAPVPAPARPPAKRPKMPEKSALSKRGRR